MFNDTAASSIGPPNERMGRAKGTTLSPLTAVSPPRFAYGPAEP
jgi:hypothetical protein